MVVGSIQMQTCCIACRYALPAGLHSSGNRFQSAVKGCSNSVFLSRSAIHLFTVKSVFQGFSPGVFQLFSNDAFQLFITGAI